MPQDSGVSRAEWDSMNRHLDERFSGVEKCLDRVAIAIDRLTDIVPQLASLGTEVGQLKADRDDHKEWLKSNSNEIQTVKDKQTRVLAYVAVIGTLVSLVVGGLELYGILMGAK